MKKAQNKMFNKRIKLFDALTATPNNGALCARR